MKNILFKYPRISIVTPSFNQGQFLEETILSVLNQGYPNLEYIIIDGRSTDNTIDIIKEYEDRLSYWVSEADKGQSHAINKGFRVSTGDILSWVNSDDVYIPNTFNIISDYFKNQPEVDVVYGDQDDIDESGVVFRSIRSLNFNRLGLLSRGGGIPQPAAFFRRKILDEIGYINESLYSAMDYDFFLRIAYAGYRIHHIPETLAKFRFHKNSKTVSGKLESNRHEEYMKKVQKKWLKKSGKHLNMPAMNIFRTYFKLKTIMKNLDRYFLYHQHYFHRLISILTNGDMHKY